MTIIKRTILFDEDWERIWEYMEENDLEDIPDRMPDVPEKDDD